jgi:hypothetical protein
MAEFWHSKGSGKTIPIFKLSAQMVDLSLQYDQRDSLPPDSPAHFPITSEGYPSEPKVQLIGASLASTTQEAAKKAVPLDCNTEAPSGLVRARREFLRISISRISNHRVRIRDSRLWTSIGIVTLTLLAFGAVYGLRGNHTDSVKDRSQLPPAVLQRQKPLVSAASIASENPHKAASKSKSRRREGDYIAKDTFVQYGKDGKPIH